MILVEAMYAQHPAAAMAPPQKPETFMLSNEAQQSLPHDAQVALQQVDNRECSASARPVTEQRASMLTVRLRSVKYFLISAPVDWSPDQYLRRFLLPTGEYVSCVLWWVVLLSNGSTSSSSSSSSFPSSVFSD